MSFEFDGLAFGSFTLSDDLLFLDTELESLIAGWNARLFKDLSEKGDATGNVY